MDPGGVVDQKRSLRAAMRVLRRDLPDQADRSRRLCGHLIDLESVRGARTVMAFAAVAGEPDVTAFVAWCRADGKVVVIPEAAPSATVPTDPSTVDLVVVPGVAFTVGGQRLGQGGGWYDRFLSRLRDDATSVGVCFEPQVVDALPVESHDVVLDLVVTEAGVAAGVTEL